MHMRLLAAGALLATLPACFQLEVQAQAGYAQLALDGDIGYVNGANNVAVAQDVESAFGLGDDQGSPYVRGQVDFGVPVLSVSAFTFEDDGTGQLNADFGNVPAGLPVATDFEMLNAKTALAFEIGLGPVSISPGIAIDYFDLQIDVRDLIGIATEQLELNAPVPLGFLRGEVDLGIVSGVAEVGYMTVDVDDVEGSLLDAEARVSVHPTALLELFVGYRYLGLEIDGEVDGDTFDTDLEVSGLLIGGGLRF